MSLHERADRARTSAQHAWLIRYSARGGLHRPAKWRACSRTPATIGLALAVLGTALSVQPASAGETDWQELSSGVRMRLISSDVVGPDDKTLLGLELDMPQTTKTYWKVPGEAGIAAELDLAGSAGLEGAAIRWPYPTIDQSAGVTDFVYFGPVVLPIEFAVTGRPALAKVSVTLGICSQLCLPAQAAFSLPFSFDAPDRGQGLRLAQAMAQVPVAWAGSAPAFSAVTWTEDGKALAILPTDPAIDPASIIADGTALGALFGAPQKSPESPVIILPVLGNGVGSAEAQPEGQAKVELNFLTPDGAFWVSTAPAQGSTPGQP